MRQLKESNTIGRSLTANGFETAKKSRGAFTRFFSSDVGEAGPCFAKRAGLVVGG